MSLLGGTEACPPVPLKPPLYFLRTRRSLSLLCVISVMGDATTRSTNVCYCCIGRAGVHNIERPVAAGDLAAVAVEAEHLAFVSTLLDCYLLCCTHCHGFDDSLHQRYWDEIRPAYAAGGGPELRNALDILGMPWCSSSGSSTTPNHVSQRTRTDPRGIGKIGDRSSSPIR